MNALHTRPRITQQPTAAALRAPSRSGFDWAAQIKLAVVLSVVAAVAVVMLAGRVPEQALIVGVIVVASVAAWSRIPAPAVQPARVQARRR